MVSQNKKQEIENIVKELKVLFPKVRCIDEIEMKHFFDNQKFASMISLMKNYMGIQCQLSVKCIVDGKMNVTNSGNEYHAVPAWVRLPEIFPSYGSVAQRNMKIVLTFHKNSTEFYYSFVQIIAHELSHVVLHSVDHPLKMSETATDIAAIMLGFSKYYEMGHTRIYDSGYSKLGYLSFEEMIYAISLIEGTEKSFYDEKKSFMRSLLDRITNFLNKFKQPQ